MEFKEASRKNIWIKALLAGKAGAGKTWSALSIFLGLLSDMAMLGGVQTEPGRMQIYIDKFGKFKVLEVEPPYTPEKLIEIIDMAVKLGLKGLLIDSLSDFWSGTGAVLDLHAAASEVTRNSFTAWKKISPRHDALFNKIMSAPLHIICTSKKKTDYILETVVKDGKSSQVPKKVGVKDILRDDSDYRFMLSFDLDQAGNIATVTKDNTALFQGKEPFVITPETGKLIRDWCLRE